MNLIVGQNNPTMGFTVRIILNNKILSDSENGKIVHGVSLHTLLEEIMLHVRKKYRNATYYNYQTMRRIF